MPQRTPRRTLSFDARSVMLFAALSMGGAALQAQTASAPSSSATRLQSGASGGGSASGTGLRPPSGSGSAQGNSTQTAQANIQAAFHRADANQDGRLSPAEAASFPAIGNRFKELDKDRDGSLSAEEFQAGASS